MKDVKRLKKYLETVEYNIRTTTGALKEFWEREFRKTSLKIGNV